MRCHRGQLTKREKLHVKASDNTLFARHHSSNPNIRATSRKSLCKYSDYFTLLPEVSSFPASLE